MIKIIIIISIITIKFIIRHIILHIGVELSGVDLLYLYIISDYDNKIIESYEILWNFI